MVPIIHQIHKYHTLVSGVIIAKGMKMCEYLQGTILLEKLPPSWKAYHGQVK